ncbi:uncharacterized protein PHACADRAFT_30658 [Phanerochaete carnosa HHB-10118-sp]|uniref:F-box domain-containing protein n=1 Tax=Phanerochaete carnosa (strain HHB-10118-sp) TaxID=650164 RepID=K5W436_PHACS|nr:uncharacterized protein PHACADRAFT_30658 [Phanerochaete carnosa HHB-10118-sp]EKM53709.1 hypothetical protein PHACADRAFT_30658 [Phanerochaete carnosa HHB-10118-sp]
MSSLAPVDMLPDDVAFEILRIAYAHSTFPYCGSNRFQLYMNSPIPISHVSRRWRDLVLSLPCLWNCIHIIPSEWRDDVDVVQAYIARSGRLPLSVEFDCRMNDAESDHSESDSDSEGSHDCPCDDVWNALFKERTRWEHLVLDARNAAHLASFTKQISGEVFPALESLQIPSYEPGQDMRVLDITAPKLTQLRATSFYYARTVLHSTPLQLFSRLTTLELVHFFYDVPNHVVRFLDMLRSASATLQVLVLRHGCFNVPIPSASLGVMPTDFPHLTFLVIESVLEYHDADYNIVSELCRAARSLDRVHILGHSIMSFHSYLHSDSLDQLHTRLPAP